MRTHTKEKPFVCPICSMGFAQKTTLRMHLRRHMDNRPFGCPMPDCNSAFVNGGLLNLHIQEVHHQRRRFSCLNGCGKVFRSNSARMRHEEQKCDVTLQFAEEGEEVDEDEQLLDEQAEQLTGADQFEQLDQLDEFGGVVEQDGTVYEGVYEHVYYDEVEAEHELDEQQLVQVDDDYVV